MPVRQSLPLITFLAAGVAALASGGELALAVGEHARADRFGDPLPERAVARLGTVRLRHTNGVCSLAFSPDGSKIASGGNEGVVNVWDVATAKLLQSLSDRQGEVDVIRFTADGKSLWTASPPGPRFVHLWDLATGRERPAPSSARRITCLTLAPDGKTLAGGIAGGAVVFWDVASGREVRRLAARGGHVTCLAFSPDGKVLAVANWQSDSEDRRAGGEVRLWDAAAGKEVRTLPGKRGAVPRALSFSPDGEFVTAAETFFSPATPATITCWRVRSGQVVRATAAAKEWSLAAAFAPDGRTLAVAEDDRCHLLEATTGKQIATLKGHRDLVRCQVFAPDGKLLASAGEDHTIRLWDLQTHKALGCFAAEPGGEAYAEVLGDGTSLLVRHRFSWTIRRRGFSVGRWKARTSLHVWGGLRDESVPRELGAFDAGRGDAWPVLYSPDGRRAALPGPSGTVCLLAADSGKEVRRFGPFEPQDRLPWADGWPAAFSRDGHTLAVIHSDGLASHRVRLFRTDSGKESLAAAKIRFRRPHGAGFSPCGKLLAVVGRVGPFDRSTLAVWDVAAGRRLWPGMPGGVAGATFAFSPDSRLLAVGQQPSERARDAEPDGPPRPGLDVYEVLTGQLALHLGDPVTTCCAFSPDGLLLGVGEAEGDVRLVDAGTGKRLRRLRGHRGQVCSLAFAPDSKTLVSGSVDTTVLVWDVSETGAPQRRTDLSESQLESLSRDLGTEAEPAYRALARLGTSPHLIARFLGKRLKPIPAPEPGRVRRLAAELDSPVFSLREGATAELAGMEQAASSLLRQALHESPSLERTRRLEKLLGEADEPLRSAAQLRRLRAVRALELAGTAAGRQVLEQLARGAPEARLTREARASLERLSRRPATLP